MKEKRDFIAYAVGKQGGKVKQLRGAENPRKIDGNLGCLPFTKNFRKFRLGGMTRKSCCIYISIGISGNFMVNGKQPYTYTHLTIIIQNIATLPKKGSW